MFNIPKQVYLKPEDAEQFSSEKFESSEGLLEYNNQRCLYKSFIDISNYSNRLIKITDAISQLFNVTFLFNSSDTDANESISGRSHRSGWKRTEKIIDFICFWDTGPEGKHCRRAYLRDLERARLLTVKHMERCEKD